MEVVTAPGKLGPNLRNRITCLSRSVRTYHFLNNKNLRKPSKAQTSEDLDRKEWEAAEAEWLNEYLQTLNGRLYVASLTLHPVNQRPIQLPSQEVLAEQLDLAKASLQKRLGKLQKIASAILGRNITLLRCPEQLEQDECVSLLENLDQCNFQFLLHYYELCADRVDLYSNLYPTPHRLHKRSTKAYQTKEKLVRDLINNSISNFISAAIDRCREAGRRVDQVEASRETLDLLVAKILTAYLPLFIDSTNRYLQDGATLELRQKSEDTLRKKMGDALKVYFSAL